MTDQGKVVQTVVTTETTTEYDDSSLDRDLNLINNVFLLTVIGISLFYISPKKPNKET